MKDLGKAYSDSMDKALTNAKRIHAVIRYEANRDDNLITWGDVADLNRINEKIEELMETIGDVWGDRDEN